MNRREFLALAPAAGLLSRSSSPSWYEKSFYLLHEDYHTLETDEVGKEADPEETARLIALSKPDVIQIHAKGNPGWTSYPTKIGHTPPKLARDEMEVWSGVARKHGYAFSAYYNIGRDGEIMKRRPEWNRQKADGSLYERALCYHSGVAEAYLWPMVEEIMDRYRPNGFWFDGSCFTVAVCYCPRCKQRFRREKNLDAPRSPEEPGWADYKEMQRAIYREFLHQTARRIKSKDPDCLVCVNWAYSLIMPEPVDDALDYLSGDRGGDVDVLSADAHWYDGQGKPFDLMTNVRLSPTGESKPPEQIEQEMAVINANGGRFFLWDNPTRAGGLQRDKQEFAGKVVAPFLRARQKWCLGSVNVPDVSLLYSSADHYAATLKNPTVFLRAAQRSHAPGDELVKAHLTYEFVNDRRMLAGDVRGRLLLLNSPLALSPGVEEAVKRYESGGGKVLRVSALDRQAFEKAIPERERGVTTNAPETVEVSLRRLQNVHVVHLVNRAKGNRQKLDGNPGAGSTRITGIPPVARCKVSVRTSSRPRKVTIEPGGARAAWKWRNGRAEVEVPQFPIHCMVVLES